MVYCCKRCQLQQGYSEICAKHELLGGSSKELLNVDYLFILITYYCVTPTASEKVAYEGQTVKAVKNKGESSDWRHFRTSTSMVS